MLDLTGELINNKYQLSALINDSRMITIYQARDLRTGQSRAVKYFKEGAVSKLGPRMRPVKRPWN